MSLLRALGGAVGWTPWMLLREGWTLVSQT